jgi:hypothetical protein
VVITDIVWKNPSDNAADNGTPDVKKSKDATRREKPIARIA